MFDGSAIGLNLPLSKLTTWRIIPKNKNNSASSEWLGATYSVF